MLHLPAQQEGPRRLAGALFESLATPGDLDGLQVLADVLEDLAGEGAEEEQCHDHDDRDQGQKQTVLYERLAILILTPEAGKKSADE